MAGEQSTAQDIQTPPISFHMMNVLKIYSLDINEFGELTKRLLAKVYEDGQVEGESFLAGFLRNSVTKTIGPASLEELQKSFTNGYYAAEIVKEEAT